MICVTSFFGVYIFFHANHFFSLFFISALCYRIIHKVANNGSLFIYYYFLFTFSSHVVSDIEHFCFHFCCFIEESRENLFDFSILFVLLCIFCCLCVVLCIFGWAECVFLFCDIFLKFDAHVWLLLYCLVWVFSILYVKQPVYFFRFSFFFLIIWFYLCRPMRKRLFSSSFFSFIFNSIVCVTVTPYLRQIHH